MSDRQQEERFFERLAESAERASGLSPKAPARLKAKIYSALMLQESQQGSLRGIPETKAQGGRLCVFEELVRIASVSSRMKSLNICRVCHARVLAEMLETPPIYWDGCPYAGFKR